MKSSQIRQTMVLTLQLPRFLFAISHTHISGSSCSIQTLLGLYAKLKRSCTILRNLCILTCSMGNTESMINHVVVDYCVRSTLSRSMLLENPRNVNDYCVRCVYVTVSDVNTHP